MTENFDLLSNFIKLNFFEKDLKNVNYIENTKNKMNNLFEKLKKFDFTFQQLKDIYSLKNLNNDKTNELQNRFYIITLGDYNKLEELNNLIDKIKSNMNLFEKIEKIILIFSEYYSKDKLNIINQYKKIKNDILNNKIFDFPNKKDLNKFDELYDEADKISELKK